MTADDLAARFTRLDNESARVDLNDWAVNTLRDFARLPSRGWSTADLDVLLAEEFARIRAGRFTLAGYLHATRSGSKFRLDRGARKAVYTIFATRTRASFVG